MLARLEDSFRRLSDFSSDLAHEFRTPISNLMTQTDTLAWPRSAAEYSEVLGPPTSRNTSGLSRMIAELLFIAKADEGQIVPSQDRAGSGHADGRSGRVPSLVAEERA